MDVLSIESTLVYNLHEARRFPSFLITLPVPQLLY